MKSSIIIVVMNLLVVGYAADAGNFPQSEWGKSYLDDIELAIDYVENHASNLKVASPPDDDSEETTNEIAYLKEISESRSSKDIILIHKEHLAPEKRFLDLLGTDKKTNPKAYDFIEFISRESYLPILYFKHKFSRTRPYQIDPELITVIDAPPHASYPSGHAAQAYLIALLLAEALEDKDARKQTLIELGLGIGFRREVAGVHYPSDTRAGVNLALQLKDLIMQKAEFQVWLRAVQEELNDAAR